MARGFRSSRGSFQAPKRQIANDGFSTTSSGTVTFGANTLGSVQMAGLQVLQSALTLVRTRGSLIVSIDNSGTTKNILNGAYGLIVVSNEAFAAGLASLPSPMTEIENDWVVYVPFALRSESVATVITDLGAHRHIDFDSRGMRKLKLGDTLAAIVEIAQSDATTGTIVNLGVQLRSQFKL